jgi:hypothetical protein
LCGNILAKHIIPKVTQTPVSPDVAACVPFFFPKIEKIPNRQRFDDVEIVDRSAAEQILAIPKNEFKNFFKYR